MEKQAKFELMEKIVRELDDLKSSQTSVIKKIAQIEAHNINLSDSELDLMLGDIHEHVAESLIEVENAHMAFSEKTTRFATDNKLFEEVPA